MPPHFARHIAPPPLPAPRRRGGRAGAALATLLACALSAGAGTATAIPPEPAVALRLEQAEGAILAFADNRLAGPVEVMLETDAAVAPVSVPALPARAGVGPGGTVLLARVSAPAGRAGQLRLRLKIVPGSSNARPQAVTYLLPVAAPIEIGQAGGGAFSHADAENRDALDFAAPVGTAVLAARRGTVMQVQDGAADTGSVLPGATANFIRILHDDGSMALYGHLALGGINVRVGERVQAGQRIGRSGNSGYSTAPHLHFVVQVNRSMRLESIPVKVAGVTSAD